MKYRLLGGSGLRVSELCLGTMTFGEEWGWGAAPEECRRMLDVFVEAGGNFIDTANRYTDGASERIVSELTASDRDRFVIATKYTLFDRKDHPNASGGHRKNLVRSLEGSLERLGTDRVDLLWVHARDVFTPIEEVMRALDDLVRAGKVLYIGVSNLPAWVVARGQTLAELRGWTRFVGLQIEYSLIERTVERELIPMAHALDLAVLAWGPIGGGVLTGKYNPGVAIQEPRRIAPNASSPRLTDRNFAIAAEVGAIAREIGRTAAQVALAWLRSRGRQVIPIVGARRADQLRDSLGCLDLELDPERLDRLDRVSRIEPGFPHEFLARENIRDLTYGGFFGAIENHRAGRV
jgi:aryl-alcohol dehydrogenase-like predicted oxidoreductase